MSENLAAFIADGIEFIVGGSLFLASMFFVVIAFGAEPLPVLSDLGVGVGTGTTALLFLVAAYAAGVLGESASRILFEWLLDRITVRRVEFASVPPEMFAEGAAFEADASGGPSRSASMYLGFPDGSYSRRDLKQRAEVREFMRSFVMRTNTGLSTEIASQLKRLRLERAACAAALVALPGFWRLGLWVDLLLWLLVVLALFGIVRTRLGRYCSAIARGYRLSRNLEEVVPSPSGPRAGAATPVQVPDTRGETG